jgi:GT2 family glycosyltransferase
MTARRPAVSVLFTTYNHERYLEQALDSIAAQTFRDFELIITDDCSTDGSADKIRAWLDRTGFPATVIINDQNLGIPKVRNNALRASTAPLVCSLAGDDYYHADRLERQVAAFANFDDNVAAVYSDMRVVDANDAELSTSWLGRLGKSPLAPPEGLIWPVLYPRNWIPSPATMVRRSAIDAVGGYDETLLVEDVDMWLRLADRFEFRFVPARLVTYRALESSLSHSSTRISTKLESQVRTLTKWLGRSPAHDLEAADFMWDVAWLCMAKNRHAALPFLHAATSLGVSGRRPLYARAVVVPGLHPLLNAAFQLRIRVAARRERAAWCGAISHRDAPGGTPRSRRGSRPRRKRATPTPRAPHPASDPTASTTRATERAGRRPAGRARR